MCEERPEQRETRRARGSGQRATASAEYQEAEISLHAREPRGRSHCGRAGRGGGQCQRASCWRMGCRELLSFTECDASGCDSEWNHTGGPGERAGGKMTECALKSSLWTAPQRTGRAARVTARAATQVLLPQPSVATQALQGKVHTLPPGM